MKKYRNTPVYVKGKRIDSKAEARRLGELKLLERAGLIQDLKTQVRFELIPSQRIDGKVAERAVNYIADFVYIKDGQRVVEDVKGYKTPDYIIKRKLMLFVHGIKIQEIKERN